MPCYKFWKIVLVNQLIFQLPLPKQCPSLPPLPLVMSTISEYTSQELDLPIHDKPSTGTNKKDYTIGMYLPER